MKKEKILDKWNLNANRYRITKYHSKKNSLFINKRRVYLLLQMLVTEMQPVYTTASHCFFLWAKIATKDLFPICETHNLATH